MASGLPPALDLEASRGPRRKGELMFRRSVFVDGHEPEEGRLHLAIQLMDYHSETLDTAETPLELLAAQHEARVLADVNLSNIQVLDVAAIERDRIYASLGEAVWRDEAGKVAGLVGRPIMPGFGKEARRQLGDDPDSRQLLDARVQIAPGFVQCTPALADRANQRGARRRASSTPAEEVGSVMPSFMTSGGRMNACYMWREDSPLLQIQPSTEERARRGGDLRRPRASSSGSAPTR